MSLLLFCFGERPEESALGDILLDPTALSVSSEFGFYPTMFFTQLRAYV